MTDYMAVDTNLPPYFLFPWFLLDMDLSHTAKLVYALLLDRARLSQLNGWTDGDERVFVIFPVEKIADTLHKSLTAIKGALSELEAQDLIKRRRRKFAMPNHIYVKLPEGQKIVPHLMEKDLSFTLAEKPLGAGAETRPTMAEKVPPNKTSNIKTNISKTRGVNTRRFLGRYENVFLSEAELGELQADFPGMWQEYIERLSEYMASTGRQYRSHAATIRRWAENDSRRTTPTRYDRDYSVDPDDVV